MNGREEMNMENCRIIAIGDNVCDKYLSRGKMYPGGQCVNTCAYAGLNGTESAYLGKFGNDSVAECVKETLDKLGVDYLWTNWAWITRIHVLTRGRTDMLS